MREVGVLDRAVADLLGEPFVAAAVLHDIERAALRLGEEVVEADEVALARGYRLALEAHESEGNMDKRGGDAHLAGDGEELPEVELLAVVGDVDDALGRVLGHAALDAREVARGVVVAAVGLPDDRDAELLVLELHDERALALLREAGLDEALDHAGHHVVVVRLAAVGVELHAELRVHALELADGYVDEAPPEREVLRVALLELHELGAARVLPRAVLLLRLRGGEDIALLQAGDGEVLALGARQALAVALDEDAELRTPVAEVVVRDDVVSKGAEDPVDGVADDGRADVPDVHLLGGVGRGVVDDYPLAGAGLRDAALRRGVERGEARREPRGGDGEVEEAGPGDLHLVEERPVEGVRNALRGVPRLHAGLLRDLQRVVALVVAKLRVGRGHDPRGGGLHAGERACERRIYRFV